MNLLDGARSRRRLALAVIAGVSLGACGGGGSGDGGSAVMPTDGTYTGRDEFRMVVTAGEVVSLSGKCDDPTGADASWDVWYGQAGPATPLEVKPPSDPVSFFGDEPYFGEDYHFSTPRGKSAGEPAERPDRGDPPLVWALHPDAFDGSPRTTNLIQPKWDGTFGEDGESVFAHFIDFDWSEWVGIDTSLDDAIDPYWSCSWFGDLETSP